MEAVDKVIREDQLNILASSLKLLPAREREIIVLRYYYDKTAKEVAELMGLSHENVRYLQSKAISRMRSLMEKQLPCSGVTEAAPHSLFLFPAGDR